MRALWSASVVCVWRGATGHTLLYTTWALYTLCDRVCVLFMCTFGGWNNRMLNEAQSRTTARAGKTHKTQTRPYKTQHDFFT